MIDINETDFPIVLVTFRGDTDDDEFAVYLDRLEAMMRDRFAVGGRAAIIFDATHSGITGASQRRIQAEWLKRHRELIRATSVGSAFVVPSPLVRGFLTAVMWLTPMPTDYEVCAVLDEAYAWSRQKLIEVSIPIGDGHR